MKKTAKIIGILVLALIVLGLLYVLSRNEAMAPTPTPSLSASISASPSATPVSYKDVLRNVSVTPSSTVSSPLTVTGEARGTWYFEASFPVHLLDANGNEIISGPAQAQGDWMTTNFVPFKITLTFAKPATATGTLVLQKDNPSGLPENDDELRIPVKFY